MLLSILFSDYQTWVMAEVKGALQFDDAQVAGRVYPERADDVAWEMNSWPAWGLVLEKLYGPETDPATWQKYDSLKKYLFDFK